MQFELRYVQQSPFMVVLGALFEMGNPMLKIIYAALVQQVDAGPTLCKDIHL